MAEDLGEKTEQPTGKRLSDARGRGQVPKSQDVGAAVALLAGTVIILVFGGRVFHGFASVMTMILSGDTPGHPLRLDSVGPAFRLAMYESASIMAPIMVLVFIAAYLGQFVQVGWLITAKPIQPKLNKINPIAGTKRLFSRRNLVKTAVNLLKLVLVIGVAYAVVIVRLDDIAALPYLSAVLGLAYTGRLLLELALWLLLVLVLLAVLDLVFQRWQHTQDLKMTKQQVKDERRNMEGDPQVKGRRLTMAREIANQRVQAAVPQADVIVTNPTHFSVAIKYDAETMGAPRVIAKGADVLAFRIRQLASLAGVPIVERPPLARALYWGVEVGQEIAPEHYQAVAEILAYVYRLDAEAGRERPERERAAPAGGAA